MVAMLNGHESTAKTLLRAFSAAKTSPKRFRAIDAIAALAQASGVTQAPDSSPAGGAAAENTAGSPRQEKYGTFTIFWSLACTARTDAVSQIRPEASLAAKALEPKKKNVLRRQVGRLD